MNRDQIMDSIELKRHFTKSFDLPIRMFENPYFYDRLCTISLLNDYIEEFEDFCVDLKLFANEEDHHKWYERTKEQIVHAIKMSAGYIKFSNDTINKPDKYIKRELYIPENHGKTFVSIDMKQANYNSLKHYCPQIFMDTNSWEGFVEIFTDCDYLKNSKHFRQVVLGECSPKKQRAYMNTLMCKLFEHIKSKINCIDLYSLDGDEIILNVKGQAGYSLDELKQAVSDCPDGIGKFVKTDVFELEQIKGGYGYMKTYLSDPRTPVFKCVNPDILPQIIKYYYGWEIDESDLVINSNGRLAKYLKPVPNPWG